jgi:hypothetical protein
MSLVREVRAASRQLNPASWVRTSHLLLKEISIGSARKY